MESRTRVLPEVRSCTVSECMVLPASSAAVPIVRARLPEDIARLERRRSSATLGALSSEPFWKL